MKKTFLFILLLIVTFSPLAHAGAVAGGASEWTQILNYSELYNQTNQSMSQLQTQISQLANLQQQVSAGRILDWGQAKQLIAATAGTIRQSQTVGYDSAGMAARWSLLYPDFNNRSGTNYLKQYAGWSKETNSAIKTALTANGQQVQNFQNDEATRASLERLSAEANGSQSQIAAVNATNQIAMGQYDEMQKLRHIQVAQNGAMLTYMQGQQQAADQKTAQDDVLRKMTSRQPQSKTYNEVLKNYQ